MSAAGAHDEVSARLSAPPEQGQAPDDLDDALRTLVPPLLTVEAEGPTRWLWQHTRRVGDTHVILLVNLSRQERITGTLQLGAPIAGPLMRLDLAQQTYSTVSTTIGALPPLPLALEPGESMILIAGRSDLTGFAPRESGLAAGTPAGEMVVEGWTVERLDDNALTLDLASMRRGNEPFGPPSPVIAIQQMLNDERYDGPLTLRYTFGNAVVPGDAEDIRLVLEHPERCTVSVNGRRVEESGLPCWIDFRWQQRAIGALLLPGENYIDLQYPAFRYGDPNSVHDQERRYGTEIEAVYVVGEFGVSCRPAADLHLAVPPVPTPPWTLCAVEGPFELQAPRPLGVGNLVEQGLPFYAGRIAYRATLVMDAVPEGPVWLELDRLSVPVVGVLINGTPAGQVAWRPYRLAIEALLKPGENTVELVLYHSLRNLLGPHHHPEGEEYGVGPHSFRGSGEDWAERLMRGEGGPDWRPSYALTEVGLFGEVRVLQTT